MRKFAIPTTERNKKNSFEQNSDAKQKGREYFLGQCASCHGIDGSGKTQIGLNLYPRVPDLDLWTGEKYTYRSKTDIAFSCYQQRQNDFRVPPAARP